MADKSTPKAPDQAAPLDDTELDAVQGGLSRSSGDGKTGIVLHEESESHLMDKKSPGSNSFDEADALFGKR